MNRSKKAARYGALAERKARERYGLDPEHDSWHDSRAPDGSPVEIKAAMMNRAGGEEGRFRIFEKYHRRLCRNDGKYVFVAYRASGAGIQVRAMRSLAADDLRPRWYGAGGHRESRQVKIPISLIFS